MKAYCFFEQSGTFKNEFRKLGIEAYDYDILDEYGQTDFQLDLFKEIRGGYEGKPSIFDNITKDDLIIAFFPCVRFEDQIALSFRGQASEIKKWSDKDKMLYDMKLMSELKDLYELVNKMFIICIDRGLRLIMENPYSVQHFLRRYWCLEPSVIDTDRRENGDYFRKPTQFWFLNCTPKNNFLTDGYSYNSVGSTWDTLCKDHYGDFARNRTEARSFMHPDYANRFIRRYILEGEERKEEQQTIFDLMKGD